MKTTILYSLFFLLPLSILLSNCTVQKRKYRDGYHISKIRQPIKNRAFTNIVKTSPVLISKKQGKDVPVHVQQVMGLTASAWFAGGCPKHTPDIRPLPPLGDSCGDRLIFQNGEERMVKVIEISTRTVKYKPCDHLDGPMHSCAKENLFMITYLNGSSEVVNPVESQNNEVTQPDAPKAVVQAKKINNSAKTGFFFALFSWTIILAPLAFILGTIGLIQINNNPEKYTGRGFALAAILIPVILVMLLLVL